MKKLSFLLVCFTAPLLAVASLNFGMVIAGTVSGAVHEWQWWFTTTLFVSVTLTTFGAMFFLLDYGLARIMKKSSIFETLD